MVHFRQDCLKMVLTFKLFVMGTDTYHTGIYHIGIDLAYWMGVSIDPSCFIHTHRLRFVLSEIVTEDAASSARLVLNL